jgi:transposase-like protein
LEESVQHRQVKYFNNRREADHAALKSGARIQGASHDLHHNQMASRSWA